MTDPWLHILGIFAAFLGFATLDSARRGRRLRPLTFFWSGLALYLVYVNQLTPTLDSLDGETVAALGLLFCAASPVIGWGWWGQHGRIRRRLLRFVGFVVLLAVSFVVWTLILGPVAEAAILAVLTAGLPFLPIRQTLRRWRSKLRSRRHRRQQSRAVQGRVASDEMERQRERAELDRLRRRETELAREVSPHRIVLLASIVLSCCFAAKAEESADISVVEYPSSSDFVVLELTWIGGVSTDPEQGPFVRVYGDGRVYVRRPSYYRDSGDFEAYLSHADLRALISLCANKGLVEFDRRAVEQKHEAMERARLKEGAGVPAVSDAVHTILTIRLDKYAPAGSEQAI